MISSLEKPVKQRVIFITLEGTLLIILYSSANDLLKKAVIEAPVALTAAATRASDFFTIGSCWSFISTFAAICLRLMSNSVTAKFALSFGK